jgi:hypothetical protein
MTAKVDFKRDLDCYKAKRDTPQVVTVPDDSGLVGAGLRRALGGETGEVGHQAHLVVEVLPAGLDGALETAEDLEADQAVQVGPGGEDPFE